VWSAYACFELILLLPVTIYFYVFHGDWFLTYFISSGEIPSAVALVGFLIQIGLGAVGFWLGLRLVRSEQRSLGWMCGGVVCALLLAIFWMIQRRVRWVGSYEQYQGKYGLVFFGENAGLVWGAVILGLLLVVGYGYLILHLIRIRRG